MHVVHIYYSNALRHPDIVLWTGSSVRARERERDGVSQLASRSSVAAPTAEHTCGYDEDINTFAKGNTESPHVLALSEIFSGDVACVSVLPRLSCSIYM